MTTTTISLILSYIACVREFTESLKAEYGVDNILVAKRKRVIPMQGSTRDGRFKYCFHGVGCRAESPEFTIDFDFGEGGSIGGFDAYRLSQYGGSLGVPLGQRLSKEEIQSELDSLCRLGLVLAPRLEPSPHLLYLAGDIPTESCSTNPI